MKIVLYTDKKGEYRWRMVTRNGRTIADSSEGYKRKHNMMKIVNQVTSDWFDDGYDVLDKTASKHP